MVVHSPGLNVAGVVWPSAVHVFRHCGRPRPLCSLSEACLFSSYRLPKATCQATLGSRLQRPPCTFGLVRHRSLAWQSRCMSLSRPFESAAREPSKASRHLWPSPAPQLCLAEPVHCGRPRPLCGLSEACLFFLYRPPKATCQATCQATFQATLGILAGCPKPAWSKAGSY